MPLCHNKDSHGGALVDGAFGVNPLAIKNYFTNQGVNANMSWSPSDIDSKIRGSKVCILSYIHNSGAHNVAIRYENGKYYAYNLYSGETEVQELDSVDNLFKENKFTAVSIITLS